MITYLQAVSVIENFATQNEMVQKFGFEFKEQMPNIATEDERYPLLFVVPIGAMPTTNTNEFEIDIYCLDRYTQDRVNVPSVVSDTQLILAMLTKWLEEGQTDMDVIHSYPMQPINNDLLDYCGGWSMRVRVEVDMVSICEIPLSGVEPTPPVPCEDATQIITNSEGNELYSNTIPSGATETQPIQDTQISINSTPVASVLAEGSKDITVELDGTPSGTWNENTQTWEVVSDPCSPVDVYIGEATAGSFPSGSDVFVKVIQDGFEVIPEDITVTGDEIEVVLTDSPDTTVNVNGNLFATVPSGGTEDVPVVNEGSNPVGTISGGQVVVANSDVFINTVQVGDIDSEDSLSINVTLDGVDSGSWNAGTQTWEVVGVPSPPPIGAMLMKTGQTTSYRTGDDGDIEAGRATDFFTLSGNNPFGNTNRFTDELGGQTYTNNIVIDWSTYNGATVLGYTKNNNGSPVAWNTAVDNSLALSLGGFSGWRLTNRKELENIMSEGASVGVLNIAPFNLIANINYWTNTTPRYDTTKAFILGSNLTGWMYALDKSAVACFYLSCKTFTVTGTTLT